MTISSNYQTIDTPAAISHKRSWSDNVPSEKKARDTAFDLFTPKSREDLKAIAQLFSDRIKVSEPGSHEYCWIRDAQRLNLDEIDLSHFIIPEYSYLSHHLIACKVQNVFAGAIAASIWLNAKTMTVNYLATHQDFEHLGIAKTLLKRMIELAKTNNCSAINLISLPTSIPFYIKHQFKICDLQSLDPLNASDHTKCDFIKNYKSDSEKELCYLISESCNLLRDCPPNIRVYHQHRLKLLLHCVELIDDKPKFTMRKFTGWKWCENHFAQLFENGNSKHVENNNLWKVFRYLVNRYFPGDDDQIELSDEHIKFILSLFCPEFKIPFNTDKADKICSELHEHGYYICRLIYVI